ncbi:SDR family NAD(P)-dependent oxidoreductase [Chloroflexota bacterium]
MKNRCVLITGSSRGLGKELALVFARNNHNVVLHGREKVDLARVEEKIAKVGVNCYVFDGDLKLDNTIEELDKVARKEDVSVLINNAGIDLDPQVAGTEQKLPLDKIDDRQIDEILTTNLVAAIKLTKRLYTFFLDKGGGTIININSLSGLKPHEQRSIYCASKWGLRGFTESLGLEAAKNKIRILGVYPGRIKTRPHFPYGMPPEEVAQQIYTAYNNTNTTEIVLDGRHKT